jgi:hypothetical protein
MKLSEYMENPPVEEIAAKPEPVKVINEDDTGIPYLAMGGVFTKDVQNLSKFVDIQDKMQVQKAIIDMFTLHPEVTDDMIGKLARNLKMEEPALENEIYAIMSSFFNKGKWVANPNVPIDPQQLQMGITEEMEHTDNPLIAERISKDHLSNGDSLYYTHLKEMENKYTRKS